MIHKNIFDSKYERWISGAFENSPIKNIDNRSKIVIMSDCHRGTGDQNDNFADNQNTYFTALCHYYEKGYHYIELGDGDELWENKKMEYIKEANSHVFWLLNKFYSQNRLHMVYGNHDIVKQQEKWRAKNMNCYWDEHQKKNLPLFENIQVSEGIVLLHRETGTNMYLLHGHQADNLNYRHWRLARFLVRYLWRPLELIGIKDPTSTAENAKRKHAVEFRLMHWASKRNSILIAGHTHRPEYPQIGEAPYFNSGSCVHPRCITAIEINNGSIALVKWSVETKYDGTLYITKTYLREPTAIYKFMDG